MANPNHVARLLKGVDAWNQWRKENWNIKPDLTGLDLRREHGFKRSSLWDSRRRKIDLTGVNFGGVDLSAADLRGADISDASIVDAETADAVEDVDDLLGDGAEIDADVEVDVPEED